MVHFISLGSFEYTVSYFIFAKAGPKLFTFSSSLDSVIRDSKLLGSRGPIQ